MLYIKKRHINNNYMHYNIIEYINIIHAFLALLPSLALKTYFTRGGMNTAEPILTSTTS